MAPSASAVWGSRHVISRSAPPPLPSRLLLLPPPPPLTPSPPPPSPPPPPPHPPSSSSFRGAGWGDIVRERERFVLGEPPWARHTSARKSGKPGRPDTLLQVGSPAGRKLYCKWWEAPQAGHFTASGARGWQ
eukprot:991162-Pyramimonas_sp.AAC.2